MVGKSRKKRDDLIITNIGANKNAKVKKQINFHLKRIVITSFVIIFVATIIFVARFIRFNVVEMLWKVNVTRGSERVNNKSIRYEGFDNGIMRISNDGVTYINGGGSVNFTVSYNMKEPIYESGDKYFLIADKNGNEFYVFDSNGEIGHNTTTSPIQKISISKDGIIYILQSDENSSYINVYKSNTTPVDISIKSTLTGDGMPVDIATSKDGVNLAVAYMCLGDNNIYSKATYYNFDEAGKKNPKRIIKEFTSEFEEKLLARVCFFDERHSCMIFDEGVYFVSLKDEENPAVIAKHLFDKKIKSIAYNEKLLAFVFSDSTFMVINKNGSILANKNLDFEYENFYISDNYIVFLYENRIVLFDERGRLVFDKEMEIDVQYVSKKKSLFFSELFVGAIDGVECIRFF